MMIGKYKETTKFKAYGKCDLLRKRLCSEETMFSSQHKFEIKDCMNEIFVGLMWLG